MNRAKVHIAAGLPLTWHFIAVATQKEDFQKYLLQNESVDFTFRNKDYYVEFAAAAYRLQDFNGSQIEKGEVIAWSKDKYNLFRQQVNKSSVQGVDEAYRKQKEAEKQLQSLKYQAEQNRKIAEREVQKLKKRIKLQSEKINEIKFFCGIGYIVAFVLSACLVKMCFL